MEQKNLFTNFSQVGFVVRDMNKTVEAMERILGVKPDVVNNVNPENKRYHGKPGDFDAVLALYNFANVQLEFIQPVSGTSIWQEHLDKHGEGLHHIRFTVDDHDEAVEYMAQKGILPSQQGDSLTPTVQWDYFDTEPVLGFILETLSKKKQ
ncbi:hypothetical protein SRRS_38680 [Sporomusa rhizae]|uniref:VOC family protein n=1 Tax=Sporomusa rhizae TaxID=357999 RepID=UPI00352AD512